MVTHSSILAWRIPWTEEPGRLQTMGLQRLKRLSTQEYILIADVKQQQITKHLLHTLVSIFLT